MKDITLVTTPRHLGGARLVRWTFVGAIAALLAPLGHTEDGTPNSTAPILLEQVIVQGELLPRLSQDTPTSAVVISGEELENRGDVDLYDVMVRTPNASVTHGEQGFSIRGVDQRGVGGGGSGRTISVQVDGVALPGVQSTFYGPYSLWDLQRVEILRGPQSTQQGRNALAGAVIMQSKNPTFETAFRTQITVGSQNTRSAALMLNQVLVEDKMALRITAESVNSDGWVKNSTLDVDDYDPQDATNYRAKLRWEPRDDLSAVLSFSRSNNEGGEDLVDGDLFPEDRINYANIREEEGSEHTIAGLDLTWTLSDTLTLQSETRDYDHDYSRGEDFDGTAADLGFFDREGESGAFQQELRLNFDGEEHAGVVGVLYAKTDNRIDGFRQYDGSVSGGRSIPRGAFSVTRYNGFSSASENVALFGEMDLDFDQYIPGLSVTVGARYDHETIEDHTYDRATSSPKPNQLRATDAALAQAAAGATRTNVDVFSARSFNTFLPKLSATYDWSETVSSSLTYQRGYRAGGTQVNNFTGKVNAFDPEHTDNYEFALRSQLMDGRLTLNANAFYTQWQDQQVNIIGRSGRAIDRDTVNAGESEIRGAEVMLEASATPNLALFASVGYAETKFLDFNTGRQNFVGNQFPNAPKVTAALGGEYRFDNNFALAIDASYTGEKHPDVANVSRDKLESYWLLNASANYKWRNWSLALYARNLLDEDYAVSRIRQRGAHRVRTGEPRSFGVFVRYDY